MKVNDRRSRSIFFVDDIVVDRFGPWLGRHQAGTAALAVYMVLARHADREASAFPSVALLSELTGCARTTVRVALHLLELAGLVAVYECVDAGTGRQTSSTYVLLTPPAELPAELPRDEKDWPDPERQRVRIETADGMRRFVEDARGGMRTDVREGSPGEGGRGRLARGGPSPGEGIARDLLSEGVKSKDSARGDRASGPLERPTMEGKTADEWAAAVEEWQVAIGVRKAKR